AAGSAVFVAAALLVARLGGVGNGFAALAIGVAALEVFDLARGLPRWLEGQMATTHEVTVALAALAGAVVWARVFTARAPGRPPRAAAGAQAVFIATSLLLLPSTLADLGLPVPAPVPGEWPWSALTVALAVGLT